MIFHINRKENKAHLPAQSFLKTNDKAEYSMFLADITDKEVFDIINNAPNKYSEDCYDLNYYCIKKFSNVLSPFLSKWFNECFNLGVFPAKSCKLQKFFHFTNLAIRVHHQISGLFPYYQRYQRSSRNCFREEISLFSEI